MISSIDFAKYILYIAQKQGKKLNQTQLQKILYICDGTLLAYGHNIIDENARTWTYGPVYPKVHKWYSNHLNTEIKEKEISSHDWEENDISSIVLDAVSYFGDWTAGQLSAWSHQDGSPWALTMQKTGNKFNEIIDKNYMSLWFQKELNINGNTAAE